MTAGSSFAVTPVSCLLELLGNWSFDLFRYFYFMHSAEVFVSEGGKDFDGSLVPSGHPVRGLT